ncbi:hypothetical protein [Amaricoccus sp.]|uniref:hypothetical protein n=1 Tax=Amaricoccus sp. TaxID=1872485 RepID=UPI003FA58E57
MQDFAAAPDRAKLELRPEMHQRGARARCESADPQMGATIAMAIFFIVLVGVSIYLFGIQTRLRRYRS